MVYQNPIYGIFDQSYIEAQLRKHHMDQVQKSYDCAGKLRDFLESTDKVEPEYQNMALMQCINVIVNHMKTH